MTAARKNRKKFSKFFSLYFQYS